MQIFKSSPKHHRWTASLLNTHYLVQLTTWLNYKGYQTSVGPIYTFT